MKNERKQDVARLHRGRRSRATQYGKKLIIPVGEQALSHPVKYRRTKKVKGEIVSRCRRRFSGSGNSRADKR